MPERPVIMLIFGDPGGGKTSLANTCEGVYLIDADKGVDRSVLRKDALQPDSWDEVLLKEAEGKFNQYKTIAIDTPKALLDDFLKNYVIKKDFKLKNNKLGMYGAIGDEFSIFVNNRRSNRSDLFIVCHAKKDEDTKMMIPDVTGGSYQLLMRIADQVGYLSVRNGQRVITFEPNEFSVGKNVAGMQPIIVPPKESPEFENFGAQLIAAVRKSIATRNEEQNAALQQSKDLQERIAKAPAPYDLNGLLAEVNKLPDYLKKPLKLKIKEKADESGWTFDTTSSAFVVAPAADPAQAQATPVAQTTPAAVAEANPDPKQFAPNAAPAAAQQPATAQPEPKSESELAFEAMMNGAVAPPASEEIPKGAAKFKTKYNEIATIETVLAAAKKNTEVADLYFKNADMIIGDEALKQKFIDKQTKLNAAAQQPATA